MTIEQTIMEQVQVLSPEKQQDVLAFIAFLNTDEWEEVYKGRFQQLWEKLRQQRDQNSYRVKTNTERMILVKDMKQLFRETQAIHADCPLTDEEIAAEIAAYRRGE